MSAGAPVRTEENPVPANANGTPAGKGRGKKGSYSQKPASYLPDVHRALPQSLDAEKGLIGSVLLSPTVLDDTISQIDAAHFHLPAHQIIFEILVEMRNAGRPIDLISVTQFLEDRKLLGEVGGAAVVTDLLTFVPTAANADYYREILREKYLLRKIISVCTEYAARSYEEQGDVKILVDEVEQQILKIGETRGDSEAQTMKDMVNDAISSIEKDYKYCFY